MLTRKVILWPRSLYICAGCLALFGGIGWAHSWLLGDARLLLLALPFAILVVRWRRVGLFICIVVCCFGLGWWRGSLMMRALAPYNDLGMRHVTLTGTATVDSTYGKHSQTSFTLNHVHMLSPINVELPGVLSVSGFGAPLVFRGDLVQVSGKLYPPFGGQQGSISFGRIILLTRNTGAIDAFRRRFAAGLQTALPEPEASFGLGLLIGQRSTLPTDVSHTLLVIGLTHIIAVSGYNLTIIIDAVRRLLGGRSKYQMAAICVLLIVVFVAITGSSPSIVRAAIISVLSIMAWYYGRTIPPLSLLLVAGAATAVANPLYIWGNVSWYLSFLAFFGVVVLGPLVTKRLFGERQPKLIAAIAIESLCAEAMTMPYVLYIFGQMSLVSLPANVIVAALVPLAMLLCLVAGLAGVFVPLVCGWLAWPARRLLTYMLDASQLLSRVPHSFLQNISFTLAWLLGAYALVLLLVFILHHKTAIITEK
ncbi:MAG TPA: ComEC/Rec2 family competence protein [Patescibacteria group bacterium]|nr:ComEC/Rec2 family competence protein [Patescibacteria group bacterium]